MHDHVQLLKIENRSDRQVYRLLPDHLFMDAALSSNLPDQFFLIIWFSFLTTDTKCAVGLLRVCRRWRNILIDPNTIPAYIGHILNLRLILSVARASQPKMW